MSTDNTALLVAGIGVIGTLTASVVSQLFAIRARKLEFQDRAAERRATAFREQRATYVALNAAIRAFRHAMLYHLHGSTEQTRAELEQARQAFDLRYAEGQLVTTDTVMAAATSASIRLNAAYDRINKLDTYAPDTAIARQERAALETDLEGSVYEEVQRLRTAMRAELGTTGDSG